MTESDINLADIEQKILDSPSLAKNPKFLQKQLISAEKPKTSQKKNEPLRKTFYNFNNIFKIDDFKFLTQKNFNQSQTLDERKRNLLVQAFRNNVATFLILRKYKGSAQPFPQKPHLNKLKKKGKIMKNDSDLFNNSNFQEGNNLRASQEIDKINIEIKIVFFEENELKKSLKHVISPESLQSEFMNKFTSGLDLSKLDESEDILNNLTKIYEKLLKDLSSKPLKVQFDANNKLNFIGFIDENPEEVKDDKDVHKIMNLKVQKEELIREIIEEQLKKINKEFELPKSEQIIPEPFKEKEITESVFIKNEENVNIIQDSQEKAEISEEIKPSYMEIVLGLKEPDQKNNCYDENIIDKLLNAKDLFEVDLDFMRPKVVYPDTPDLQFTNDDEKKIFGEIHKWLFEIETELEEENRTILEYKKNKMWSDPQDIFQIEFPEADDDDDDENEENSNKIEEKKEKNKKEEKNEENMKNGEMVENMENLEILGNLENEENDVNEDQ